MSKKSNDQRYQERLARITKRDIITAVLPHEVRPNKTHHHITMADLRIHLGIRKDDASLDKQIKQVYRDLNGGANPNE